jgi:predicted FMN-binding regulatory protein PaiB
MAGNVGFEAAPSRVESKFKMSQNRLQEDRAGVIQRLKMRSDQMVERFSG